MAMITTYNKTMVTCPVNGPMEWGSCVACGFNGGVKRYNLGPTRLPFTFRCNLGEDGMRCQMCTRGNTFTGVSKSTYYCDFDTYVRREIPAEMWDDHSRPAWCPGFHRK